MPGRGDHCTTSGGVTEDSTHASKLQSEEPQTEADTAAAAAGSVAPTTLCDPLNRMAGAPPRIADVGAVLELRAVKSAPPEPTFRASRLNQVRTGAPAPAPPTPNTSPACRSTSSWPATRSRADAEAVGEAVGE